MCWFAKPRRSLEQTGLKFLAVGGGVSANRRLRRRSRKCVDVEGVEFFVPPLDLCTDNAAMAALAVEKWKRGEFAPLDLDAQPSLT